MKRRRVHLNIRKCFFTVKVPKEVVESPFLELFKKQSGYSPGQSLLSPMYDSWWQRIRQPFINRWLQHNTVFVTESHQEVLQGKSISYVLLNETLQTLWDEFVMGTEMLWDAELKHLGLEEPKNISDQSSERVFSIKEVFLSRQSVWSRGNAMSLSVSLGLHFFLWSCTTLYHKWLVLGPSDTKQSWKRHLPFTSLEGRYPREQQRWSKVFAMAVLVTDWHGSLLLQNKAFLKQNNAAFFKRGCKVQPSTQKDNLAPECGI